MKEYQPRILVLSGGGVKGISFVGALQELENTTTFRITELEYLSGSSIGGIICTAICFGYTLQEIYHWFLAIPFSSFCPQLYDTSNTEKILPKIYNTFSIGDGKELENSLYKTFDTKHISRNITFQELYTISKKHLYISGSNITSSKAEYFSHTTTPNMKVFDALCITSRIPFVFPYIQKNSQIYVDGHIFDPFPVRCIPSKIRKKYKKETLGIISSPTKNTNTIENIKDYTFSILEGISIQYMKKATLQYKKNIISIMIHKGFFTLETTEKEIKSMYEIGKQECVKYIETL